MKKIKASLTSIVILGACGAIAYNVLFTQDLQSGRPGSTAVRVQVKDVDVSGMSDNDAPINSIGELAKQTSNFDQRVASHADQNQTQNPNQRSLALQIQAELGALGYYRGEVDGKPGPQTLAAIKQYQSGNGLTPNGLINGQLLDHIKFTRKISEAGNNTATLVTSSKPDMRVKQVQEKLIMFGYNPGKPDGVAGQATLDAIKQFQSDRSMPATGKLTAQVMRELGV